MPFVLNNLLAVQCCNKCVYFTLEINLLMNLWSNKPNVAPFSHSFSPSAFRYVCKYECLVTLNSFIT